MWVGVGTLLQPFPAQKEQQERGYKTWRRERGREERESAPTVVEKACLFALN